MNYIKQLQQDKKDLEKELGAYQVMVNDVLTYLHSDKFSKFQANSPGELCDKVQVDDAIRRLDINQYY